MKVFLTVAVDVWCDKEGVKPSTEDITDSVQEAVFNAISQAEQDGYDHALKDDISILFDYAEVKDTDMVEDL